MSFIVKEEKDQRNLWEETLNVSSNYYTGPDVASTATSETQASIKALEEISQWVAVRLLEGQ